MRGAAASLLLLCVSIAAAESTYFGTTSDGRLEAGCKLPASGANFTAYSRVLRTAGRTYVHCDVREILLEAYRALGGHRTPRRCSCTARPASGGAARSPLHRSHQNGLSVDFMCPVVHEEGRSVPLPISPSIY